VERPASPEFPNARKYIFFQTADTVFHIVERRFFGAKLIVQREREAAVIVVAEIPSGCEKEFVVDEVQERSRQCDESIAAIIGAYLRKAEEERGHHPMMMCQDSEPA
jgi:hypothetical protein